ncbi:unnamed protein product (mitochondrion) [Plasmodiophora brassicae]|uniref:Uncharacterized protein n=1 Tax=Plasmodiophora brassicae TaxID=37360 RepID=A0A3P3YJC2_PLABS|nr:unnamed protein product [Plasmodiophora brassicae]
MPLGSLIHVMMPLLIGLGEAFRLYPNDCQSAFKVTDVQAIIHSGHMRDEMKQGRLSASVWPIANVSMLKVLVDFMNDNGQIIEDILQWVWDHVSALSHDERVLLLTTLVECLEIVHVPVGPANNPTSNLGCGGIGFYASYPASTHPMP